VYCHHGVRSAHAIHFLEQQPGFNQLYNLTGGIHAWAQQIDASMPIY
jgi:sulfur-carrier protein adenylyltransferase/sulfurtransferase